LHGGVHYQARRADQIAFMRRHVKPSPLSHIQAYERRFGSSIPKRRRRRRSRQL
jgi:hypothetical protein